MKRSEKITLKECFLLTFGTLLVAAGIYFFQFPNHFSTGGVSGLSILIVRVLPGLSPSMLVAGFNLLFLLLGFVFISSDFGTRTVYCTVLFSLALQGMGLLFPLSAPLTDQRLLELVFAVMLSSLGTGMLFHQNASTGGTDIAAMILRKYTQLDIGKSLMYVNFLIAVSSLFLFDVETGLFSILGLLLNTLLVDYETENLTLRKSLSIVTTKPEETCAYINRYLKRSATVWQANGAYTHENVSIVFTALGRSQANDLRQYVKTIDPDCFVVVNSTSEIYGKGFQRG